MFRTIAFIVIFIPWTLFVIVTGVPIAYIDPGYLHSYARFWARLSLWLSGVSLQIEGSENIPKDQTVVYMPNHASNFDILTLFAGLPGQFRFVAKMELFKIPLFGLAMKKSGYISIDRSDRKKAFKSVEEAGRRIADGASVVIFPEGTRSPDGDLHEFKTGGFILAQKAGVPIVPVAIEGSFAVMRKSSLLITPGTIRMKIFEPVSTMEEPPLKRTELIEKVRTPIAEELAAPTCPENEK